jgi:hypothetical protein
MMVIYKIKVKKTYCVTDDCIDYGGVLDMAQFCYYYRNCTDYNLMCRL